MLINLCLPYLSSTKNPRFLKINLYLVEPTAFLTHLENIIDDEGADNRIVNEA